MAAAVGATEAAIPCKMPHTVSKMHGNLGDKFCGISVKKKKKNGDLGDIVLENIKRSPRNGKNIG